VVAIYTQEPGFVDIEPEVEPIVHVPLVSVIAEGKLITIFELVGIL
jgi:hypothetical protein